MAIPPSADAAPRAAPVYTLALVAANLLIFVYTLSLGAEASAFVDRAGLVPREFLAGRSGTLATWFSPLTSMFLHGGWLHLASNLVYLLIFGAPIEERLGGRRFLAFYLGCGLAASAIHIASDPSSYVSAVGASGAISGLLGACAVTIPLQRLRLRWPPVRVPARLLLGLWIVAQVASGLGGQGPGPATVASWSHLGGALAGLLAIRRLRPQRPPLGTELSAVSSAENA